MSDSINQPFPKIEPGVIVPEGSMVSYSSYLKVNELLALQTRLSEPPEHDEMLFIVIHQVYELWFKQILHELNLAESELNRDSGFGALKTLKRITSIMSLLTDQVGVLESMTPNNFNSFRSRLNPASGFQSWQFRLVEFRMGLKDSSYQKFYRSLPDATRVIEEAKHLPSFYDHVLRFLARKGYAVPQDVLSRDVSEYYAPSSGVENVFLGIYQNHVDHYEAYVMLESLVDFDQQFTLWRYRHVAMVERMIGARTGTGGSSGVKYLSSTLSKKFFPELWSLRSLLGSSDYGQKI